MEKIKSTVFVNILYWIKVCASRQYWQSTATFMELEPRDILTQTIDAANHHHMVITGWFPGTMWDQQECQGQA